MTVTTLPIRTVVFADPPFSAGAHTLLGDSEVHHLRVLRLGVGERIGLRDGVGTCAAGTLVRLTKTQAMVEVDEVAEAPPPAPIHLMVPVADRDRMLWLAEKAAELNVATWRPVVWRRSRSVSPRGDGPTFRTKVQARMISALVQSRSAWLPELFPEAVPDAAIAAAPEGRRIVLDANGASMLAAMQGVTADTPVTLAIGPEGGFEEHELAQLVAAGFVPCTLGASVLRFETAAVAAVAVAKAAVPISV